MSTTDRQSECVTALQRAKSILGHSPSRTEYDELGLLPSSSEIERRFGSWNDAKRAAGLEVTERHSTDITDEDCRTALLDAADELGGGFSRAEYDELGWTPQSRTIIRHLGGWNEAKRDLGLEVDDRSPRTFDDVACLLSVLELTLELGRSPKVVEYRESDRQPSAKTITDKLGGWRDVREWAESAIEVYETSDDLSLEHVAALTLDAVERVADE